MTIAYWCVLVFILTPYALAGIAKSGMDVEQNRQPRAFLAQQKGYRQRANWAQLNTFETLGGFVAGVLIAHQVQADQMTVDILCCVFLGCRILYAAFYLADWHKTRSLAWIGALICIVGLFVASAFAG